MRSLLLRLSAFSLIVVLGAGCSRESTKGGPGADKGKPLTTGPGTPAPAPGTTADSRDHFTIKVPAGHTNVTQDEQKEITVTVDRDGKFDQDVTIKFEAPEGVKVDPSSVTVLKGKTDTRVSVHANPDAKVGTTNIHVSGTGGGGPAAKVELGIDIKAKKS